MKATTTPNQIATARAKRGKATIPTSLTLIPTKSPITRPMRRIGVFPEFMSLKPLRAEIQMSKTGENVKR
jgi:hypothetical protein